jgi:hypothetical protein
MHRSQEYPWEFCELIAAHMEQFTVGLDWPRQQLLLTAPPPSRDQSPSGGAAAVCGLKRPAAAPLEELEDEFTGGGPDSESEVEVTFFEREAGWPNFAISKC